LLHIALQVLYGGRNLKIRNLTSTSLKADKIAEISLALFDGYQVLS